MNRKLRMLMLVLMAAILVACSLNAIAEDEAAQTEVGAAEQTEVPEVAVVTSEEPAEVVETPAPAADDEEEIPAEEVIGTVVTIKETDIRLEADGLSEIFATVPEGTELDVLFEDVEWIKVIWEDQIGYIYYDCIAVEEEAGDVTETETSEGAEEAAEMKVTIFSSRRTVMEMGDEVVLTSKLVGFEGYTVTYQWQCDMGNGFEDVPGANSDSYTFEATVETLSYDWCLLVYFE